MYQYRARITDVIDGDTVHADIDLGCDVHTSLTLKLAGITTPSTVTDEGQKARDFLDQMLSRTDHYVLIKTIKDKREKYGRYLAFLYQSDPEHSENSINDILVEEGFAKYHSMPRLWNDEVAEEIPS
jgi:micrococcal nuclease